MPSTSTATARKLLADELGLEPGAELRQLEKAILEHDPGIAAPARARPPETAAGGPRRPSRSRIAVVVGALLLAGALAAVVLALTGGSEAVTVEPNSVAAIDPRTGRIEAAVPIGGHPVAIAVGEGGVWVANRRPADAGTNRSEEQGHDVDRARNRCRGRRGRVRLGLGRRGQRRDGRDTDPDRSPHERPGGTDRSRQGRPTRAPARLPRRDRRRKRLDHARQRADADRSGHQRGPPLVPGQASRRGWPPVRTPCG